MAEGMLTGMTAQEVLDILPGPGSYYYNLYKAENPALVAEAEAIRNEARAAAKRGEAPSQPLGGLTFGGGEAANVPTVVANEPVAAAPTLTTEQQNFLSLLQELGLGALSNAFQGTTVADPASGMMSSEYTPVVPQMPVATPVDFSMNLPSYSGSQAPALTNNLAYNPFMGLYEMPTENRQQTLTEQTGLFNYIYGPQG
jgi:hypothetical protein